MYSKYYRIVLKKNNSSSKSKLIRKIINKKKSLHYTLELIRASQNAYLMPKCTKEATSEEYVNNIFIYKK